MSFYFIYFKLINWLVQKYLRIKWDRWVSYLISTICKITRIYIYFNQPIVKSNSLQIFTFNHKNRFLDYRKKRKKNQN